MCGIVGAAGALTAKTDKIVKNLLILDTIRGIDSTGIAAVNRNGDCRVVKQIGNAFDLFGYKVFDAAMSQLNRVIIGHNRFATQGSVNKKNAHPFDFDTLVGAHNGTLSQKHRLKDANAFTVDSENLYWHLEQEGMDSLMKVLDGAWSLVWWDKTEQTLNFLRNKERPMWMCTDKAETVLFWASEPWMLDVALNRESIDYTEPVSTIIDQHYSFSIGADAKIGKPHVKEVKALSSFTPAIVYHGNNKNFRRGQESTTVVGKPALTTEQRDTIRQIQQNPQTVSVTPSGKVVEFSKKKGVTPVTVRQVAGSSAWYKGRNDVLLEALAECTDIHGAKFIACFDPENRHARIRLYLKSTEKAEKYMGKDIHCSVGEVLYSDAHQGVYYKVQHSSVKVDGEDESGAGLYFMNARGRLVPKAEWLVDHSQCAWCTSPVFPEDNNRFTKTNDVLCPECSADEEVQQYVDLK